MTLQEWREDPSAQKKTWIALCTVAFMLSLLWLPSLNDFKRFFSIRPHVEAPRQIVVATPHPVPVPITPPSATTAATALSGAIFNGRWAGEASLPPKHGLCKLTLEIGENPDGTLSGYSTLGCQPPASDLISGKDAASKYFRGRSAVSDYMRLAVGINPASAILTGTTDANGVLHFKVTKNIGIAEANHGCNMTSADATPFGAGRIAFEFHEEGCPGGQILMTHTK